MRNPRGDESEAELHGNITNFDSTAKTFTIRDVKVADYLPAILVAPLLVAIVIRVKEAFGL